MSDPLLSAVIHAQAQHGLFDLHDAAPPPGGGSRQRRGRQRLLAACSVAAGGALGPGLACRPREPWTAPCGGSRAANLWQRWLLAAAFHFTWPSSTLPRSMQIQMVWKLPPAPPAMHFWPRSPVTVGPHRRSMRRRSPPCGRPGGNAAAAPGAGQRPARAGGPASCGTRTGAARTTSRPCGWCAHCSQWSATRSSPICAATTLTWVEDETNTDLRFARNHLRHVVLPALASLNPNIVATLARTAGLLADEAQRAEAADAAALAPAAVEPPAAERIVLDWCAGSSCPLQHARGVLRLALDQLAPTAGRLATNTSTTFSKLPPPAESSGPHPLPEGLAWTVVGATAAQAARLCLHAARARPCRDRPPLPGCRLARRARRMSRADSRRDHSRRMAADHHPPARCRTCRQHGRPSQSPWQLYAERRGPGPAGPYHAPARDCASPRLAWTGGIAG